MKKKIEEKIDAISTRYRTININEKWYKLPKDIDISKLKVGNTYSILIDGKNILEIKPIEAKEEDFVWRMKDWRITRLAAVERAIMYLNAKDKDYDLEEVFDVAEKITEFVYSGRPPKTEEQ